MEVVLFDTNVIIDYTKRIRAALDELTYYDDAAISVITWMEACCKMRPEQIAVFETSMANAGIKLITITDPIMRTATQRRFDSLEANKAGTGRKIPLADCIIWATAEVEGRMLVTCNANDFKGLRIRVPYINTDGVISDVKAPP